MKLESNPGADIHRLRRDLVDAPGQVLILRNVSSRTYEITSLSLLDCENVRGGCQRGMSVSILLLPGETVEVLTVFPDDPRAPFSLRWGYGGRPLSPIPYAGATAGWMAVGAWS